MRKIIQFLYFGHEDLWMLIQVMVKRSCSASGGTSDKKSWLFHVQKGTIILSD